MGKDSLTARETGSDRTKIGNCRAVRISSIVWCVIGGIVLFLGIAARKIAEWYDETYDMELKELLYTLMAPLEGTGNGMIKTIVMTALPSALAALGIYTLVAIVFLLLNNGLRRLSIALCAAVLANSFLYSWQVLGVEEYINAVINHSTLYEDYYVDPDTISITADGTPKNLIYIYLESMETTYASESVGGKQERENYMPNLTKLAFENVSFSDKEEGLLGGFIAPTGTTWTIAAMLASMSGVPFAFPMKDMNKMNERINFASGLTTLGDILAEKGYCQEFLCGSDAEFGGRKLFLTQHGGYEIFDLFNAREEGYIDPNYNVWWGYEDKYLFEIAKNELTELAAGNQPFNFTMLTVDTHAVEGYVCELCDDEYACKTANVVSCSDAQVYEFIEWCRDQDFYKDTVIVLIGDHPRHDQQLIGDTLFEDRTMYNCFINSAVSPAGGVNERVYTTMDIFPTVLAAMGFTVEGDRLGLGVNLFSEQKTLSEQIGYQLFNEELGKYSEYYVRNFS